MPKIKIGIIGGSGLDNPEIFDHQILKCITTPFGRPSDLLIEGRINGVDCVVLSRHGRKHQHMPGKVNYRANIWALKEQGCTHIIATTAVGSLQEEISPGTLVIPDSFIDRTQGRTQTFYDGGDGFHGVCHIPMSPAFSDITRQALINTANELGLECRPDATCVTIEGPRFSSKAESKMFQSWGGHIINMTTVPEVVLAKEAGLCYACVALVTDYCSWRDNEKAVSVEEVLATFKENVHKVVELVTKTVPKLAEMEWQEEYNQLQDVKRDSFKNEEFEKYQPI